MEHVMVKQHLTNLNAATRNGNLQRATTAANGILRHYNITVPQNTNAATRISWAFRIKSLINQKINLKFLTPTLRNKIVRG